MLISKKIGLLVAVSMATSAFVSVFGLYGLKSVNGNMEYIATRSVPALQQVSNMRSDYLSLITQIYERASITEADQGSALEKKITEGNALLLKEINLLAEGVQGDEEKKALEEAKFGLVAFVSRLKQLNGLAATGETQLALEMIQRDVGPIHERLSKAFDKLVEIKTGGVANVAKSAESSFNQTLTITIASALLGVGLIGVWGFMLGKSIIRPLRAMQQAITRTASDLDFTDSMRIDSDDEIGTTLAAYNALLSKLRSSFAEVQAAARKMVDITSSVDQTSKEIAENSLAQSDAASGMAAAIEELTVSISMVATQADDASLHTQESSAKAEQGAEVILATVKGIQTISESVSTASNRIDALRHDSESISSVANIIKEIADQTNLLALNAAIEAARAGEQGRGFAVVADEVRKLAERTTKSTQEISTLLAQMQDSAKLAVFSMEGAVAEVNSGVRSAQLAGQSINEIKSGSSTVVQAVGEISEAVREQSAASTSISQRIEQIAQMTERNTVAAESTAEAVHEMSNMSKEIASALSQYKV